MNDAINKLARILRISPEALLDLDRKMSLLTGQEGVIEGIIKKNEEHVDKTLTEIGMTRDSYAEDVYQALVHRLEHIDEHLYELLDRPDMTKLANACGKLCEVAFKVFTPPKGFFIKKEKVVELLEKFPPDNMLQHFGYATAGELVEKEGFASVVSGLRFTQSQDWMHQFFDVAYKDLTAADFEEREVELIVLDVKWLQAAEKFLEKKYHNISHLKEYGVIFVIPLPIDTKGETMRMMTLIMHYLHEVPFYSDLFRKFKNDPDFITKLQSLLRGDVPEGPVPHPDKIGWRIVQRYLAKDDERDPRLSEPHVNPEADHWYRAEDDLERLSRMLSKEEGNLNLAHWTHLDFVGDFFKNKEGKDQLVSFDLIDLIMSLVKKGEIKYLYHQEEALWNKLFSEYLGRERMQTLINEHIIDGFIEL